MPTANNLTVLVVDDQESMRGIVKSHLRAIGIINAVDVPSVKRAKEELGRTKFNLVLSDFNMEGETGVDLLKWVRENPEIGKMPFIMITGNSDATTIAAVKAYRVNNYIVKPVSAASLRLRIEQVLGKLT